MGDILLELSLILVLILLNGFFASAEIAVITARRGHLEALVTAGRPDARRVLALREEPGRFLSTVQIGVTLVGTLASAIGGASAVRFLEPQLAALPVPWLAIYAEIVALLLVVAAITYLSLVLGELVPKELALRRPETLAMAVSGLLDRLSRLAHPFVWILTRSSGLLLRPLLTVIEALFPGDSGTGAPVTDGEILAMMREGVAKGAFHPSEQVLVTGIFRFADRQVGQVMRPRTDISAVPGGTPLAEVLDIARQKGYTRYPVYEGSLDDVVGVAHIKDMVLRGGDLRRPVREVALKPLLVPGSLRLIEMLREFQRGNTHLALVLDEYGGTAGLITLEDLLEEIVGRIEDEYPHPEPGLRRRSDGTVTLPGLLPVRDLADMLGVAVAEDAPYETVAGLILYHLGHIPQAGEAITYQGYRLIVQEMEGRRIRQVVMVPVDG